MARTVLVSGASIGGPALAFWLHRYGFEVTVVEKAPELRTGGYKIDLRGAAIEVADRMGLLDAARAAETEMQSLSFVNDAGKRLVSMPAELFMGRGEADVEVMRGDLSQMLFDATKDDVEYLFGESITGLVQGDDGVAVSFEKAAPRTFDLVVGADGLHSNVRALAFGDEAQYVRDLGYQVSIAGVDNHLALDREELIYTVPGRTVNVYSTKQMTGAKALFLFAAPQEPLQRRDVAGQKAYVAKEFTGAGWETDRLLAGLEATDDFYFDSVSQVRMDGWTRGRVALVGDAGYCPCFASGQGTSLAMVGAYVLAGELAAAGGDHVAAFAAYDREMRTFVEKNQELGRNNIGQMIAKNRFQSWMGVQMMKVLPKLPWRDAIVEKMIGPVREAATAIELKDYQTPVQDGRSADSLGA
ncbi:FAD-dependent monooxygenase [Pseudonocardia sp. TRM90224]|uniref:FAD-dependent monooxygenase n=1 Tax=Pseudonocardia sp. TRM90224 TaxID=2812678 RepID=UPI001E50A67E|nr:FAD-dependent monooxygenase [Pseudonocardia sp. TRM90224]